MFGTIRALVKSDTVGKTSERTRSRALLRLRYECRQGVDAMKLDDARPLLEEDKPLAEETEMLLKRRYRGCSYPGDDARFAQSTTRRAAINQVLTALFANG